MTIRKYLAVSALILSACQSTPSSVDPDSIAQPRNATFYCPGGETLQVESLGSSVTVTRQDGSVVALPALPAGSRSRYSEGQTALVFDGRDALFMITGKPPMECKR